MLRRAHGHPAQLDAIPGLVAACGLMFVFTGCQPYDDAAGSAVEDGEGEAAHVADSAQAQVSQAGASYCSAQAVLDKACVACHDGKGTGGAPMGLTSYADLVAPDPANPSKKVFQSIKERTHDAARPMPPKGVLPTDQLKALDAWIAAGAPPAPASGCATSAATGLNGRVDGWKPEACDEIYRIGSHAPGNDSAPYTVQAGQEINTVVAIKPPWGTEPVQAIGFKPYTDNAKVLHHWILLGQGAFLAGWAPGDDERPPFPSDVGMAMPSGAQGLSLNLHYFNKQGTTAQPDRSGVDVCVLKKNHFRPKVAGVAFGLASIGELGVLAPAGAKNRPITSVCTLSGTEPVHLLTAGPHAHKYAVHMTFTATQAGRKIVMHDAPFKFGEQGTYPLPGGEIVLNKGDQITTTCVYSNPTTRNITIGESTENEMCFNFAMYYPKGSLKCAGSLF